MDSNIEEWKDIPGYKGIYQASNLGRIKSLSRIVYLPKRKINRRQKEIILTFNPKTKQYPKVSLHNNSEHEVRTIHNIIGLLFVPNPNKLPFLNHKNGIKTDPRACNLEWCSHLENIRHAFKNGLIPSGEDNHKAKLSNNIVLAIKRLYRINPKVNQSAIARKLGVQRSIINGIVKKRKWNYVE